MCEYCPSCNGLFRRASSLPPVISNVGRSGMRHRVPAKSSPSGAAPRVSPTVVCCVVNWTHYGHESKQFPLIKSDLKNRGKIGKQKKGKNKC